MGPVLTADNKADIYVGNIKHFSKLSLGVTALAIKFSDFNNLIIRKFSTTISFARKAVVMQYHIVHVFLWGPPDKVNLMVMGSDSITVATNCSGRSETNKGYQDKMVNTASIFFAISQQPYIKVASFVQSWLENLLRLAVQYPFKAIGFDRSDLPQERACSPIVTYFVPWEPRYRKPSLLSLIGDRANILSIHGRNLLLGFGWAEPVLLHKQQARLVLL